MVKMEVTVTVEVKRRRPVAWQMGGGVPCFADGGRLELRQG